MRQLSSYNSEEKYWYGQESTPLYHPDVSIGQVALSALLRTPAAIAQIYEPDDTQQTCIEIAVQTIRIAKNLKKLGLSHEDVIGICAANTKFVGSLALGALLAGVPFSPLDPSFDKEGVKHIYGITKPKLMFCDGEIYEKVKEALDELNLDCPIYTMKNHLEGVRTIEELVADDGEQIQDYIAPKLALGGKQTAVIVCSSGSTGLPKGVSLSHSSITSIFVSFPANRTLCTSTLYWLSGVFTLLMTTISGSPRILTDKPFTPELMLGIIEKYRASVVFGPPSQMALMVKSPLIEKTDLSCVQSYFIGGSALPQSVAASMQKYLKNGRILVGYGLSEACGGVSAGIPHKQGANGRVSNNVTVKIIGDDENRLGPGETGEIRVKLAVPWNGYYNNPEATAAAFDSEGWLKSADLGYFTAYGELFVVGRKKEIYKYKNFHYYPSEIEDTIAEIPDVVEVTVCGLPDDVATDLPAAAVVKKPGSSLTEQDVYDYVADKMAHFKHLYGGVYFLESLPKTVSGKNLRQAIQNMLVKLREERSQS